MSANQKKAIAYAFCFLIAIIVGGCCAGVAALLSSPPMAIAGAGAAGWLAIVGIGVKIIGPFDFGSETPPTPPTPPGANQTGTPVA
ncbi:hypothetical protein [Streptomyces gilvus]|uniref:hypothetical protein n=1 Tax=Streptomyces gilvus TaxID=2920937 RepID=UPI001F0FB4FF|nr:hypothetical protein [Streptomyces sp. CME 23]MCH5676347.1 hypothetical protein [Streptomyces sp. CME 23]